MGIRAFSLIELMTVVAIVGLLSAVAVPSYKDYITRVKLTLAQNYLQQQIDRSIEYYNIHGTFGNVAQIGLPVGADNETTPDPTGPDSFLAPYIVQLNMAANTTVSCPWGGSGGYVTDFGKGNFLADNTSDVVVFQNIFIDVNGTITKYCAYTYWDGGPATGSPVSGDFVSNCVNLTDDPGYVAEVDNISQNACD